MIISLIIPVLDDNEALSTLLPRLQSLRQSGHEVIVVDGGSTIVLPDHLVPLIDNVIESPRGRARQMNAGADVAKGDVFWFLHADSQLPEDLDTRWFSSNWGWFNVRLSGHDWRFRIIEWFMNRRARMTSIATGDQGLFVQRALFLQVDGFPDIELMEDIEICAALRRINRPSPSPQSLLVSSRYWERHGVVRSVVRMWRLRFLHWAGVSDEKLLSRYYPDAGL